MKAVIMAGGKGTRLKPLTCAIPKPMVPLLDRPVMEYALQLLKRHGITEVAVTVQHLPEVIRHYFGDGSEFGVKLHYFEEETPLGTAGSVKNAEEFLDEPFLVISGDALTDFDLTAAREFHRSRAALGTILLARVEMPLEFGVVMTDEEDRITRLLEKPGWSQVFSDTVNTGIYLLEPEVLTLFNRGEELDFSRDLFPIMLERGMPLYGYKAEGYWSDIGNLQQYRQTQFDMLDGKVDVELQGTEVKPGVWVGAGAKTGRGVSFGGPVFIGKDVVLGDGTTVGDYTIIGSGCLVKQDVVTERGIVWKNTVLEAHSEVRGATIGKHTIVGRGACLLEGTVIGDSCQVGDKSTVEQGIKIWPGKVVEHHTRLHQSLIWGEYSGRTLFGSGGVRGSCHSEMTALFATKLAMAYGTVLPVGAAVGIGQDGSPYGMLLAEALAAGLHASGIHTHEFGSVTSAITRYAIHQGGCTGGLQVRRLKGQAEEYIIELMDHNGLLLDQRTIRKVEMAFAQEEYRRILPELAGQRVGSSEIKALYREHLLRISDTVLPSSKPITLVVHRDSRAYAGLIPEVLERLGCRVIYLEDTEQGEPYSLPSLVEQTHADFGVTLDRSGMLTELVADDGSLVGEEMLEVLQILLQLEEEQDQGILYVPAHAPVIVEGLGVAYNRPVVRTVNGQPMVQVGREREGFFIRCDGLYLVVRLLEFMAREKTGLSRLLRRIPVFATSKRKVECPWQDKGKVMRFLLEETRGERVELLDGIKVFHEEGWTLIMPDSVEPVFQVLSHAGTEQTAEAMAGAYVRKIEDFRRKTTAS